MKTWSVWVDSREGDYMVEVGVCQCHHVALACAKWWVARGRKVLIVRGR